MANAMRSLSSARAVVCILLGLASFDPSQAHPLTVYLQEGFNGPGIPGGWVVTQVSGATSIWSIVGTGTNPPIAPYAGTGQAKFNSYDAEAGDQSRLTSRRVNLSAATDPFLSFFMYHDDEFFSSVDSLYVDVTTGDSISGPWTTLAGYRRPQVTSTWKQEIIPLFQYGGAARVFISFRGKSQFGNNVYVDEMRIADSSFHDIGTLALVPPSGPVNAAPPPTNISRHWDRRGKFTSDAPSMSEVSTAFSLASPLNISTIVQNYGSFAEPAYQVKWQIDGTTQTNVNNSRTLPRNDRDTLTLSWLTPTPGTHVITAWTSLLSDSNHSNDSLRLTVAVLDSSIIFAEMFNGGTFPPSGWTAINRDGGPLAPWFQGTSTSIFLPYEGTGFAANNFQRANGSYIDDYLISPPIAGIAPPGQVDSLRFWVRSAFNPPPATNYPDSVMVLLSTSGADTSNFTIFIDYFSVPKSGWTLRGYKLTGRVPNNSTIRVALRYLHYNGGSAGANSDFVGVDFFNVVRGLPSSVGEPEPTPLSFKLQQNYPNPFNPSTEIYFSIDQSGMTTLDLYNVLGERVANLFRDRVEPRQQYHVRVDGSMFPSGVYYYRLQSGSNADVKKLVLLR